METLELLNVGAGHRDSGAELPAFFRTPGWREIRLDIDPRTPPTFSARCSTCRRRWPTPSMPSIPRTTSNTSTRRKFPQAISEFLRVLKPEGLAVITCPDLQSAGR